MYLPCRAAQLGLLVYVGVWATACSEPPHKEMDQARGALDAALAAGAAEYAPSEYRAAEQALERSYVAATDQDHRLALSQALDARERARNAAKQAADQKATVRSEAETALGQVEEAVRLAVTILEPWSGRVSPGATMLREGVREAEAAVVQARHALRDEDYLTARSVLDGVLERLQRGTRELDEAVKTSARSR